MFFEDNGGTGAAAEVKKDLGAEAPEEELEDGIEGGAEEELEGDFELDENGDIILPDEDEDADDEEPDEDDVESDEEDAEAAEDGAEDTPEGQGETDGEDAQGAQGTAEVSEPAKEKQPNAGDAEREALRSELEALKSQCRDMLARMGVQEGDLMKGLVKVTAEAAEQTPEEYLRQKEQRERTAEAMRTVQAVRFAEKAKADLAEVHAAYPETRQFDSVDKLPNFAKFGQFRDLGLSPKEAYSAANPDAVRASVAAATKRQSLNETKSHLKPVVSKQSKDNSVRMTKQELAEYRDLFPDMSDKEIFSLYRRTKKM